MSLQLTQFKVLCQCRNYSHNLYNTIEFKDVKIFFKANKEYIRKSENNEKLQDLHLQQSSFTPAEERKTLGHYHAVQQIRTAEIFSWTDCVVQYIAGLKRQILTSHASRPSAPAQSAVSGRLQPGPNCVRSATLHVVWFHSGTGISFRTMLCSLSVKKNSFRYYWWILYYKLSFTQRMQVMKTRAFQRLNTHQVCITRFY